MVDLCLEQTPSSSKSAKSSASTGHRQTPSKQEIVSTLDIHLGIFATQSVLHRLSATLTAQVIARIGVRWHNAHNKDVIASIIRDHVIQTDMDQIADSYDDMRKSYPAGEMLMVTRFLRTGQHAARQHRENVAKIVASLFKDTPTDAALVYVKKEVFGVEDGSAIMLPDHPAIKALLGLQKGGFCLN
jgi:hypothetical protein